MELALWLGNQQPWDALVAKARLADELGLARLYFADHLMGNNADLGADSAPTWESTAALAMLAASTQQIAVGHMVASATFRPVGVFAKWAATVHQASGGRLVVGLGAGWQTNEHSTLGIELGTPGERVARLAETCGALRALWTAERASFDGQFVKLQEAPHAPKPDPLPPLLIGGKGPRLLRVVARFADEWNTWSTPDTLPTRIEVFEHACSAEGRDPATIRRSTQALLFPTDSPAAARDFIDRWSPRAALAGPMPALAAQIARWSELGVGEVVIPDWNWTLPNDIGPLFDFLAYLKTQTGSL